MAAKTPRVLALTLGLAVATALTTLLVSVAPARAEYANPYGVAVIVGNRDYQNERVPAVAYAHRDAEAFRRYVVDVLGFDPNRVFDVRDATQAEMFTWFGNRDSHEGRLWRFLHPRHGSDVVVFYSGHGVPGLKDRRGYLLPSDADPDTPEINGYPIDLLYANLGASLEAKTARVFLDACFSGDSDRGMLIRSASPVFVQAALPEASAEKLTVLSAASGSEVASWDEEAGHGMFTHHLLDALYGEADLDGDGRVTAVEAKTYLDDTMTIAARVEFGRHQNASLNGEAGAVLARAGEGGAFPRRPGLGEAEPGPDATGESAGAEPPPPAETAESAGVSAAEAEAGAGSDALRSPFGGRAILDVRTEPAGARVLVGGELAGETPLIRSDLRAGTWTVVLDHPLHETVSLEGQELADRRVLKVRHRLVRTRGEVTVLVTPAVPGAWVEHGGSRHEVPVTLEGVLSGPVELTLGAPGHQEIRLEVEVPKGDVALVEHRLEPVRYGTLTVSTEPADAQVEVPGAGTYRSGMRLPEGVHRLRVSREGYRAAELEVEVSGESSLRVELERELFSFTVVPIPSEAEVRFLDAAERYRPGMELPSGRYRVRVSAEGWRSREETVVHGRAATRRAVRLDRLPPPAEELEAALELTTAKRKLIQHGLASLGIEVGLIDGLFGPRTRESIAAYQRKKGYAATGYLTSAQAGALLELGKERLAEVSKPKLEPGKKFRDCDDCPEMVVVPAGSYMMGSPSHEDGRVDRESPVHRVTIPEPFAVGVYEVTFREWDACRRDGGCSHAPGDRGWGRGDRPVIAVSWEDAKEYVRWLSRETGAEYRLLSESEWEYAARAGTTGPFHFGSTISPEQANYDGNYTYGSGRKGRYRKRTEPVGSFPPNAFGLHDVHGNVREWVEDCWHGSYRGAPSDGRAWTTGGGCVRRVLRGGSWGDEPRLLRSADRYRSGTGLRLDDIGFRIARTLD